MAIKQVFSTPGYLYCCVDNASSQAFPTLSDATHIGYDTASVVPDFGAATGQAASPLGSEINQSQPDFVEDQKSILNNPATATIGFANPS